MLPCDLLITKIIVQQNDQLSLWKFCPFPRKNWIHINIHRWKNRRETNFVDKNFCLLAKFLSFFPEEGSFNQLIEKENIVVIFATGLYMSMIKIYFHLVFLLWLVLIFSRVWVMTFYFFEKMFTFSRQAKRISKWRGHGTLQSIANHQGSAQEKGGRHEPAIPRCHRPCFSLLGVKRSKEVSKRKIIALLNKLKFRSLINVRSF